MKPNNVSVIRAELHGAEDSADLLIAQFGRLATALATARVESGLPARIGHQAMALVTQAMGSVVNAREQVIQAHKACAREGKIILPEIAWGDEGDCPPVNPSVAATETARLRSVG